MMDPAPRSRFGQIGAAVGGLLALGVLVVVFVLLGKLVAEKQASKAEARPTTTAQLAQPSAVSAVITPEARLTATPSAAQNATPSPTPPGTWIALSPDSGPPGTTVEIQGYLPNGPSPAEVKKNMGLGYATLCWTDCQSGLKDSIPVQWSSARAGHFTMRFQVPTAPWLAANGPQPLAPGTYAVGVQCLAPSVPKTKGPGFVPCGLQPAQATATFHLIGPAPSLCANEPCARLSLTPDQGPPGTLVQLRGWAPLTGMVGGQPQGYTLVLQTNARADDSSPAREKATAVLPSIGQVQQAPNGDLSGAFQVPASIPSLGPLAPGTYTLVLQAFMPGVGTATAPVAGATVTPLGKPGVNGERITLAPTPFTVTAAPSWVSLGQVTPLRSQWSAQVYGPALGGDPANPGRLAYCTAGAIRVSPDGGKTWSTVPTNGAVSAVGSTPFEFFQNEKTAPRCATVVLDPSHPDSYYATFAVVKKGQDPPPENLIGLATTDDGLTWWVVPPPDGYTLDQFGGFQITGQAVVALFGGRATSPGPTPFAVEQTTDGGRTWTSSGLACPAAGPCLRWGPAPSSIGGMGVGYPQPIEVSTDHGQSWTTPSWPSQAVLNQGPSELVALSQNDVVLLSGSAPYPLVVSHDGGRGWQDVALPGLGPAGDGVGQYPGLQMLPNGSLLARGPDQSYGWLMLPSDASHWCQVTGASLPTSATSFWASGDRLWWLQMGNAPAEAPTVGSVAVSDLQCGQSISTVYLTPTPTPKPVIAPDAALRAVFSSPSVKGSSLFGIFPREVKKEPCTIHAGGPAPGITIKGICVITVQVKASLDEVELVEGWNARDFHGGNDPADGWLTHTWAFFVNADGKVVKQAETGSFPPQEAR